MCSWQTKTGPFGKVKLYHPPNFGKVIGDYRGHDDGLGAMAISNDGLQLLTGSGDRTARLWQLHPREFLVLRGHESGLYTAEFSPTGEQIVTSSRDSSARLWDLSGQQLAKFDHDGYLCAAEFTADGKRILTNAYYRGAVEWALDGTQLARHGEGQQRVLALHVTDSERWGVVRSSAGAKVVELNSKQSVELQGATPEDRKSLVWAASFVTIFSRILRSQRLEPRLGF